MRRDLTIRESRTADVAGIESLYPEAFPDEDLLPLVRELLGDDETCLSLVGAKGVRVVAHAIFTSCGVVDDNARAALLGPIAVSPDCQKLGIGSAIVRAGLQRLAEENVDLVCVLGDPAYYSRLGFSPENHVEPPYALPDEWRGAWQSQYLHETSAPCSGKLAVPRQWQQPELWAP